MISEDIDILNYKFLIYVTKIIFLTVKVRKLDISPVLRHFDIAGAIAFALTLLKKLISVSSDGQKIFAFL